MILWFALLMSVVTYFFFARFLASEVEFALGNTNNNLLIVVFAVLSMILVIGSFFVKRRLLAQSIDKQDVALVQKGHILAWAMCEVSAMLGMLERFVIGYRQYYLLMLLAAIGIAVQFPKREHLLAASYKNSTDKASF